jgi:hypothetical protein
MVQATFFASVAVAALKVTAAAAVPVFATVVVKVVVPQPVVVGAVVPLSPQFARFKTTLSFTASGCVTLNAREIELAVLCLGVAIVRPSLVTAATAVAVEDAIVVATGFVAPATVAEILRVARLTPWGPGATVAVARLVVIVHVADAESSVAVATLKVMAAVERPEFATVVVKVVVPQPEVVGAAVPVSAQFGSVTVTLSLMARGTLSLNAVATVDFAPAIGVPTVATVAENTGTVVCVEVANAAAATLPDLAVIAIVRVARSAAWAAGATVMPLAITMEHAVVAASVVVVTVNVRVAATWPEFAFATVNSVLPQPVYRRLAEVRVEPKAKVGRTTVTLSSSTRAAPEVNATVTEEATPARGVVIVKVFAVRAASATAARSTSAMQLRSTIILAN